MEKELTALVIGYWQYASLEELHHRSRMWLSEIVFWREELEFMEQLINDHFLYFVDRDHIQATTVLLDEIKSLHGRLSVIEANVAEHEIQLKQLIQEQHTLREQDYRDAHGELEGLLNDFLRSFKLTKRAVFSAASKIVQEERMKRLI